MPDETFTSANDSYAIEGLAQQIVLEARSGWAGIFALTGALGYGTWWLSKSSIVRVATQTGLEGINAFNIAFDCKYERIQGEWDKYEGGMRWWPRIEGAGSRQYCDRYCPIYLLGSPSCDARACVPCMIRECNG
ncbi:hypothetical protein PABG_07500 [Paracoccidioides brasiliensis Pb03]|nr:hypothetical protein PABG_07500 [Paracoccidioides brasiliensis Pb03]